MAAARPAALPPPPTVAHIKYISVSVKVWHSLESMKPAVKVVFLFEDELNPFTKVLCFAWTAYSCFNTSVPQCILPATEICKGGLLLSLFLLVLWQTCQLNKPL